MTQLKTMYIFFVVTYFLVAHLIVVVSFLGGKKQPAIERHTNQGSLLSRLARGARPLEMFSGSSSVGSCRVFMRLPFTN